MIRVECEQGSVEWIRARAGIPTASSFDRIITPKTAKLSASAGGYLCDLAAERLLGVSLDPIMSEWMERGKAMEESAVAFYELQRDVEVDRVGFCLRDDRGAGCSPDGLVGEDGGLEIKCPGAGVHIGYFLAGGPPSDYRCQIQGSLWVTGRAWWDFLSYNPALPSLLVRVERDEEFIAALAAAVEGFAGRLEEAMAQLAARGIVPSLFQSRKFGIESAASTA